MYLFIYLLYKVVVVVVVRFHRKAYISLVPVYTMTKKLCISVTDDEDAFLKSMDLSPTGLLKQRIAEVKQNSLNYQKKLQNAIDTMQEKIDYLETVNKELKLKIEVRDGIV